MKNMTVTVPTETYYRARISAASCIVGKMLRQMAEQNPAGNPPKNI